MANTTKRNQLARKPAPRILARWDPGDFKNTTPSISKTNFRLLSSYNWLSEDPEGGDPSLSIVVPGEY